MRRLIQFLLLVVPFAAALAYAQGGPPFITDDPGTPGNRHWEINTGFIGNHNPAHASYQLPNIDINYGWGDRIQLMVSPYLAAATDENCTTRAGLGETIFGVKWRYFEHYRAGKPKSDENKNFTLGTYPQVTINNPTSSVRRGVVDPGPQYFLPAEFTAKWGPIDFNGEVARLIGNHTVPDRWGRGLIVGHEFSERLELYGEIYDLQDISRMGAMPKQRELTLDVGGRKTLDRAGHLRLMFLGGRAIQAVTRQNSEPDWMAYIGVQILFGPKDASDKK